MLLGPNGDPVPRVVSAAQASELGFGAARVRTQREHGRWQQLFRGVYLTRADRPERNDWLAAGLIVAGPTGVVSGWDALRPRGIGADRPPTDTVLILTAAGTHRTQRLVCFRPSARPVEATRLLLCDGHRYSAPCAGTARAVADTALVYRLFDPVRALVTSAIQRRLCTVDELQRELDASPQNGSAHLRRAMADVVGGAESIAEAALVDLLRAGGLPAPELNVPIVTADGIHVATADALWRSLRAGLEVDSKAHHFFENRWRGTMQRHNLLTAGGLSLTHYPPADLLQRPHVVLPEIERWLRGRARELGVAYPPASASAVAAHTAFVLGDQQA